MEEHLACLRDTGSQRLRLSKRQQNALRHAYGKQLARDPSTVSSRRDLSELRMTLLELEHGAAMANREHYLACNDPSSDWLASGWDRVAQSLRAMMKAESRGSSSDTDG